MLNKKIAIYFDMDGVLADFGKEPNPVERFATEKGFFYNLKPIKKNIKFINKLIENGYNVNILSASPNKHADLDKMFWIRKYIPKLKLGNAIFCRNHENKADFVDDIKNSILIDDYTINLINWKNKGGKVVKFVNSYDKAIGKHQKYDIPYVKNLKKLVA